MGMLEDRPTNPIIIRKKNKIVEVHLKMMHIVPKYLLHTVSTVSFIFSKHNVILTCCGISFDDCRCRFHQYFTRAFFVRNFGAKKCARIMLMKLTIGVILSRTEYVCVFGREEV